MKTSICQRAGCGEEYTPTVPWRKYCDTHRTYPGKAAVSATCPDCGHHFMLAGTQPA